jgi:hypothetical protein
MRLSMTAVISTLVLLGLAGAECSVLSGARAYANPANLTMRGVEDRYFPNLTTQSGNDQWEFSATSPDNAVSIGGGRPWPQNFKYVLKSPSAEKPAWTREQTGNEASPMAIWVHDKGHAIVYLSDATVVALDPAKGTPTISFNIRRTLSNTATEQYAETFRDGPAWGASALWYMMDHESTAYFVVRTWWGQRYAINLDQGTMAALTFAETAAMDAREKEIILTTLKTAADAGPGSGPFDSRARTYGSQMSQLLAAAHQAGRLKITEAVGDLQKIEKWDVGTRKFEAVNCACPSPKDGLIDPSSAEVDPLRQTVQLSLRRLGTEPAREQAVYFHEAKGGVALGGKRTAIVPADGKGDAGAIRPGMTPEEVLAAAGNPDIIKRWCSRKLLRWEYDVLDGAGGSGPATIQVRWNECGRKVEDVQRVQPAVFDHERLRDMDVIRSRFGG